MKCVQNTCVHDPNVHPTTKQNIHHLLGNCGQRKNSTIDRPNVQVHNNAQGSLYHYTDQTEPIIYYLDRANNKPHVKHLANGLGFTHEVESAREVFWSKKKCFETKMENNLHHVKVIKT